MERKTSCKTLLFRLFGDLLPVDNSLAGLGLN